MEQIEAYESYETQTEAVVVKVEDGQEPATAVPSAVYPNWAAQQCYESPVSPILAAAAAAAPAHYNQPHPYFSQQQPEFAASFHSTNGTAAPSNGYFVPVSAPSSVSFDEHMKGGNCSVPVVPVAHGHGYVLYQACLGPGGENGQQPIDANDLYAAMKNLSLRPIGAVPPMSYPTSNLVDSLAHQAEMASNGPFMAAVPMARAAKPTQATCNTMPASSCSTPPAVTNVAPSNAYLASVRVVSLSALASQSWQVCILDPYLIVFSSRSKTMVKWCTSLIVMGLQILLHHITPWFIQPSHWSIRDRIRKSAADRTFSLPVLSFSRLTIHRYKFLLGSGVI